MLEDEIQNSGNAFPLDFVERWKIEKDHDIKLLMVDIAAVYRNFRSMQQTGKVSYEPSHAEFFREMVDVLRRTVEGKRLVRQYPSMFQKLDQAYSDMKRYSSGGIMPNEDIHPNANKVPSILEWLGKK